MARLPTEVFDIICSYLGPSDIYTLYPQQYDGQQQQERREKESLFSMNHCVMKKSWNCQQCGQLLFHQKNVIGIINHGYGIVIRGWKYEILWMGCVGTYWKIGSVKCGGCFERVGMSIMRCSMNLDDDDDEEEEEEEEQEEDRQMEMKKNVVVVVEREWIGGVGGICNMKINQDHDEDLVNEMKLKVRCDGCGKVLADWSLLRGIANHEGIDNLWEEEMFLFQDVFGVVLTKMEDCICSEENEEEGQGEEQGNGRNLLVCCGRCGEFIGKVVTSGHLCGMVIVKELAIAKSVRMRKRLLEINS